MRVIRREFHNVSRSDVFTIVPIGDIHIGSASCDESRLKQTIERIKADDRCYWLGMGDYAEWINRNDPRFEPGCLAKWLTMADLVDLSKAQKDRFLGLVKPIAHKCLALIEGNHELTIKRKTERDIFSEIVTGVKEAGNLSDVDQLGLGIYGWLQLMFHRSKTQDRTTRIDMNLHHGFVGGRLVGAKALNMQRWLWSHDCDLAIFGHSHNTGVQIEAIETINHVGDVSIQPRIGAFSGTFRKTANEDGPATYSEVKGYFPVPLAGVEIRLRPGAEEREDRIRVIA